MDNVDLILDSIKAFSGPTPEEIELAKSGDEISEPVGELFREAKCRLPADAALDAERTKQLEKRATPVKYDVWDPPADPIEQFFKQANDAALGLSAKPTTGTLAARLGVVRSEVVVEDGTRWLRGFNADGQLVDVRMLLPEIA